MTSVECPNFVAGNEELSLKMCNNISFETVLESDSITSSKEKLYSCHLCDKQFTRRHGLKRHFRIHTDEKPYSCGICDKKFSRKYSAKVHYMNHSKYAQNSATGNRNNLIEMCKNETLEIKSGTDSVANIENEVYSCDSSKKQGTRESDLELHCVIHTDNESFLSQICNSSSRKSCFKVHCVKHSRKKKKYFRENEKPLITMCKKLNEINLESECADNSENEKYSCDLCDKLFTLKSGLKRHYLTHTKEKPYSCEMCDKKYSRRFDLKNHRRIHTKEEPFSCKICSKSFSRKYELKDHIEFHNNENPFSCDICNKNFSGKRSLKEHSMVHTKEKPYSCDVCQVRFTRRHGLFKHSKIHSDVARDSKKKFSCDLCHKRFTQKHYLKKHFKIHTRSTSRFGGSACKANIQFG